MKVRERFDRLSPARRKTVIWSVLGIFLAFVTITGYSSRSDNRPGRQATTGKEIRMEQDLIEKTIFREHRRKLEELEGRLTTLQRELERERKEKEAAAQSIGEKSEPLPLPVIFPPPPIHSDSAAVSQPPLLPSSPRDNKRIGRITVVKNDAPPRAEARPKGRTVYLPPSFMEANLLTGFDAATSGSSKNSPEPLLLRIKTPAVLPNDVKAELSGCFVIAEAVGRLDKERADVRLVSLSCLSNEGRAVIDTEIKGFVTDADSKVGLSGRVVSRMGAVTVRAIVAGLFEGAGDAFRTAATTTSTSALGSTTLIDSAQVGKSALGTGLSQGAKAMSDFYLDLVKQTTPVIEVGAARKITVIVSEGRELEIRDLKNSEFTQQ